MGFLLETLSDLDTNLKSQIGCPLVIGKGNPDDFFAKFVKQYKVKSLTFEAETVEPYGIERDKKVVKLFKSSEVKTFNTHTLYDPDYLLGLKDGVAPKAYKSFTEMIYGNHPNEPIDTAEGLPNFSLPKEMLVKEKIVASLGDLQFYEKVPKIADLPAYKG